MLALLFALAAGVLWAGPSAATRLADLTPAVWPVASVGDRTSDRPVHVRRAGRRWWTRPWFAAGLAGLTALLLVSGLTGLLVAVAVSWGTGWLMTRTTSAHDQRRADRLRADLPLAVDLLVACVTAGRDPAGCLAVVAEAVGGPLAEELRAVAARLGLGAEPATVWAGLVEHPVLAPLGRTLLRSSRTGSSVVTGLARCADDLRRDRRAEADTRARQVGVRATLPLGLCFLPAFVLAGVVPTVVGGLASLSW